jgi:choline dehydrogenase-like flavoprotein
VAKDGLADGAVYYDSDGRVQRQRARIVVMACNGIGTPRLLLNSQSSLFPDGLANSSGLVGRNLMFHPVSMVMGVFDEALEGYKGPLGCSVVSSEFYETDLSRGFVRGYQFQILRSSGPAVTAQGFVARSPVPWGSEHHWVFNEHFGRTITVSVMGEDLPEPHNRVVLDATLTDSDGIPAPKVDYKMSENSLKMMDHGIARATELLEAAGAKEVLANPLLRPSGWHLLGTARMGSHLGNSVVDGYGRCHDVKNLFIIDGSIFATAGAVNPTSTIQALALYIADNFKQNARHLLD